MLFRSGIFDSDAAIVGRIQSEVREIRLSPGRRAFKMVAGGNLAMIVLDIQPRARLRLALEARGIHVIDEISGRVLKSPGR